MYGLVLEGGGARGAYHIGACKAIMELGIDIAGVAGTSVGALNGAMIAQGDWEKAYNIWYNISPEKIIKSENQPIDNLAPTKDNFTYYINQVKSMFYSGGLDISPLRKMLEECIDEDKIRTSPIDFGMIAVSLTELKAIEVFKEDIPYGKMADYLLASAALPIFKLDKMEGQRFLDGAFYDNLPINLLASRGFKDIIVVRTNSFGIRRKVKKKGLNLIYISPQDELGKVLDFDRENARNTIEMGYYDTFKIFKNLKGKTYYISSDNGSSYFFDYFAQLGEENIIKLGKLLGLKDLPYRRMMFEEIIPHLNEMLHGSRHNDYEDIALLVLEEIATDLDLPRFRIYERKEFIKELAHNYIPHIDNSKIGNLPDFVKHNMLVSRMVRDQLLEQIVYYLFGDCQESCRIFLNKVPSDSLVGFRAT